MSPPAYRYRALAATLADELRAGLHPPGAQLPSVRELRAAHGASLATVTHALHDLEDAGLIEARPRRGFFVRPGAPPAPAAAGAPALALAGRRKRLMALAGTQAGCLSLGHLGLPAPLLPLQALRRHLALHLRADSSVLASGSAGGAEVLREQLALRSRRLGCHFEADDIVVTQGQSDSLQLCLRLLTEPGDVVAVASPAPLRLLDLIVSLGLRWLEIPTSPTSGLSVPALQLALQQQQVAVCVVEPSFDSVTGSLMSDGAKRELAALLAQHQRPLIECDMMGDLHHGVHRPRPVKAFDTDDRVLYCGSFACTTGPGFSVGHVVSARHRLQLRAARAVHGELLPSLIDRVLAGFMADGGFERHLRRLRQRLARQVADYHEAVLAHFPSGTRVSSSEGAHVLWVELPAGLDACVLLEQARAQGYTFVPGAVFSMGTQFDHCLRLTAGNPLDEQHAQGIRTLGDIATRLAA